MKGDIQFSSNTSIKVLVTASPNKYSLLSPASAYNILQMAAFPIAKMKGEDLPEGAEWKSMDIELHVIVDGDIQDIITQNWAIPCDKGMTDRLLALPDPSLAAHYIELHSLGYDIPEDDFDSHIEEMLKDNGIKSKDEVSILEVELKLYIKER